MLRYYSNSEPSLSSAWNLGVVAARRMLISYAHFIKICVKKRNLCSFYDLFGEEIKKLTEVYPCNLSLNPVWSLALSYGLEHFQIHLCKLSLVGMEFLSYLNSGNLTFSKRCLRGS